MALQHLHLLAVLQADDLIIGHRLLDWHGGLQLLGRRLDQTTKSGELAVDHLNRDGRGQAGACSQMRGHDVRGQLQNLAVLGVVV